MEKKEIILGTVQFGLDYGVNNSNGKVPYGEVSDILDLAGSENVRYLDTALQYGDSIDVLARYFNEKTPEFKVISKFRHADGFDLEGSVNDTLGKLGIPSLYAYLFHSYEDFIKYPAYVEGLMELKKKKKISHTGISVYTNEQMQRAAADERIDLIQFPYNLLDNANLRGEVIRKAKEHGKILHVRSVFLQGLFFMESRNLPKKLVPLRPALEKLNAIGRAEYMTISELAFKYVMANEFIDGIVLGVDSAAQLKQNLELTGGRKISGVAVDTINNLRIKETELLNPSNWK